MNYGFEVDGLEILTVNIKRDSSARTAKVPKVLGESASSRGQGIFFDYMKTMDRSVISYAALVWKYSEMPKEPQQAI